MFFFVCLPEGWWKHGWMMLDRNSGTTWVFAVGCCDLFFLYLMVMCPLWNIAIVQMDNLVWWFTFGHMVISMAIEVYQRVLPVRSSAWQDTGTKWNCCSPVQMKRPNPQPTNLWWNFVLRVKITFMPYGYESKRWYPSQVQVVAGTLGCSCYIPMYPHVNIYIYTYT